MNYAHDLNSSCTPILMRYVIDPRSEVIANLSHYNTPVLPPIGDLYTEGPGRR